MAKFRQPPNSIAEATIVSKNITANGTYNASSDSADGYNPVTVNVPSHSYNAVKIETVDTSGSNPRVSVTYGEWDGSTFTAIAPATTIKYNNVNNYNPLPFGIITVLWYSSQWELDTLESVICNGVTYPANTMMMMWSYTETKELIIYKAS